MIKDVLIKIKMSTCVKVQETHFYQVSWRFSKKYKLLKGGMPSLLKFLSIPLIPLGILAHFSVINDVKYGLKRMLLVKKNMSKCVSVTDTHFDQVSWLFL